MIPTRIYFLAPLLMTLIGLTLMYGWLDGDSRPAPSVSPAYCARIGDDDCNGMITPDESGWKCVPTSGGPLLC